MAALHEGWLSGSDGTPLFHRWAVPEGARAMVLHLHGYSEHSGRHAGWLEHLVERGFGVLSPDHRGHGRTGPTPGDLGRLDLVLADVGAAHRAALVRAPGLPLFVFGHSMGALLALRYLQLQSEGVAGVILNGPAVLPPASIPRRMIHIGRVVGRIAPRLPLQPFYDPVRGHRDLAQRARDAADPCIYRGWIRAGTGRVVMRAMQEVEAAMGRIELPILITMGTDDRTVPAAVTEHIRSGIGSTDVTVIPFEGLRHEVYLEPERHIAFDAWSRWLEERL